MARLSFLVRMARMYSGETVRDRAKVATDH